MQVNTTIRSVDKTLEDLTKSLPPDMINWLKQRFESVFQNLTGLDFAGIRVDFVVDTNSIINSLLRYAQGKDSILFRMINNPIFRFHAPAFIENEVSKFILTAKKKIDKDKIFEGWRKIKRVLKVGTEISTNALILSNIIIGKRDPKDVPFVAMFLDLGAKNIITYDKDFE
jgi:predicted nucleic acid-binding protein